MKKDISIILIVAAIFTFFFRLGTFDIESDRTYDESVYIRLAGQITHGFKNYNTILIYADALKLGRKLPDYFKKPLFKHPPLFPILISISSAIFGPTAYSALGVALFFGALLVLMAYLLGSLLFNNKVGVYAALLMVIEPISWVCSQRVWMETTLAFFICLAVYLFIRATKKYNPYLILLSGIAVGLAALTKYPGILSLLIIILYALCFKRELFRNKFFIASLAIPFIMLLPWICWNYKVYGTKFISDILSTHGVFERMGWSASNLIIAGAAVLSMIAALIFSKNRIFKVTIAGAATLIFLLALHGHIIKSLTYNYIPSTGWTMGMFGKEPSHFYLGRLIELSPFYIFSFLSLFLWVSDKERFREYFFLYLSSFVILGFFIWWKNYQCRYIMPVVVFLIVLSARAQSYLWERVKGLSKKPLRYAAMLSYALLLLFFLFKTLRVDLAYLNKACYF